jgi:hypothetical protein
MSIVRVRGAINEAFAGIERSAVGIVAIVALINTIRRSINWIFEPPFSEWLLGTFVAFGESLILGVLVVLAVAWSFNRTTRGGRQYVAIGVVVIGATGAGCALMANLEGWDAAPPTFASMWLRHALIGLLVAGERLSGLYGDSAGLQVIQATAGCVEARLDIPLELAPRLTGGAAHSP